MIKRILRKPKKVQRYELSKFPKTAIFCLFSDFFQNLLTKFPKKSGKTSKSALLALFQGLYLLHDEDLGEIIN